MKNIDNKITRENQKDYSFKVEILPEVPYEEIMWKRINELKKDAGETQDSLAIRLGYADGSSLSRAKNDKNKLSTVNIIKIAKHYNVSTDYLLGLTDIRVLKYNGESEFKEEILHYSITEMLKLLPKNRHSQLLEKIMQENM